MVSTSVFKRHKCDTESLKGYFTADPKKVKAKKDAKDSKDTRTPVEKLCGLIRDRIKDGRDRALKDYRTWAAVDLAYDAPFHQETPTIIRSIMNSGMDAKGILAAAKSWGLCEGELFCKGEKEGTFELNNQIFHNVLVPFTKAYLTSRLAKIFNDRNLDPTFKFEPRQATELNRVQCAILTDIVDEMAQNFGYAENLKQMIFNALMYSVALEFPVEPWTCEEQEDDGGKDYIVREGVRYTSPHITQQIYDQQYPVSTFNTDTGCTFGGFWKVSRAGDVLKNNKYWNTDRVGYDDNDWLKKDSPYRNYFEQVYPCTLELPRIAAPAKETDRETIANVYTSTDYDKAIFETHLFMKLIPKDWGLGTYKHPVWFRFIVASADTVVYAEPFPYCPVTCALYDPDQNRGKNASFALEIIPTQDLVGNTLTQIWLTIKRNLANIIFYDKQMDADGAVQAITRRSQWQYQAVNFVPYDGLASFRKGVNPESAFHEVKFAFADTSQMLQSVTTYISILERLLGISAQEVGAAASHQQGNKEIDLIASSSSNRLAYTASGIDAYIDAKKRQVVWAWSAYGETDIQAQVNSDIPNLEKHLKELGFSTKDKTDDGKIIVKGKKTSLKLTSFASTKDGPDRVNDMPTAQAMFQAIASINQNQALAAMLDPISLAKLVETAAKLAGANPDFVLKLNRDGVMSHQLQQMAQQLAQEIQAATMKQVEATVAKPAAEAVQEQEQQIQTIQQQLAQIASVVEKISQMAAAATTTATMPPPIPEQISPNAIETPAIAVAPAGVPVPMV